MNKIISSIIILVFIFIMLYLVGANYGFMDESIISNKILSYQDSPNSFIVISFAIAFLLMIDIILPIPSSIVMVISGQILGFVWGGLISFIGAMLSAITTFILLQIG